MRNAQVLRPRAQSADACTTRPGPRGRDGKEEPGEETPLRGEEAPAQGSSRGKHASKGRK